MSETGENMQAVPKQSGMGKGAIAWAVCGAVAGAWFGIWRAVGVLLYVRYENPALVQPFLEADSASQWAYLILPAIPIVVGGAIAGLSAFMAVIIGLELLSLLLLQRNTPTAFRMKFKSRNCN